MSNGSAWLARLMIGVVAVPGLAWAGLMSTGLDLSQRLVDTGRHLQIGDRYGNDHLVQLTSRAMREPLRFCDTDALEGALMAHLRLAEGHLAGEASEEAEERLRQTVAVAQRLLGCAPQHGFALLALAWSKGNLEGFGQDSLRLLMRSYDAAPRESWIAQRRNLLAVRLYRELPARYQDLAFEEWLSLLGAYQIEAAAISLTEAEQPMRDRMLASRSLVEERTWLMLGNRVGRLAPALVIPGAEGSRTRPWR